MRINPTFFGLALAAFTACVDAPPPATGSKDSAITAPSADDDIEAADSAAATEPSANIMDECPGCPYGGLDQKAPR